MESDSLISEFLENKIYSRQDIIQQLQELKDYQDNERDNIYHNKIVSRIKSHQEYLDSQQSLQQQNKNIYKSIDNQPIQSSNNIDLRSKDDEEINYQHSKEHFIDHNANSKLKLKKVNSINSYLEKY